jgi:hypothetical protein
LMTSMLSSTSTSWRPPSWRLGGRPRTRAPREFLSSWCARWRRRGTACWTFKGLARTDEHVAAAAQATLHCLLLAIGPELNATF